MSSIRAIPLLTATAVVLYGCAERLPTLPDGVGAIQVQVAARGSRADSAAYALVLLGRSTKRVRGHGNALFTGLAPRDYVVRLTDLSRLCSVEGLAEQRVTVEAGDTAHLTFAVRCSEPGNIRVKVTTTGAPLDPDGYTVLLDGSPSLAAPVNGNILLTDLDSPSHTPSHDIQLRGVADNCWFNDPALIYPRRVELTDGDTASVSFELVCREVGAGAIAVRVNRSGDPFGYFLTPFVSRNDGLIRADQAGLFQDLPQGAYVVGVIGGVPFHIQCSVAQPNPMTISLSEAKAITLVFDVHCVDD